MTNENPGGWPSVPGVPLNPEVSGWHWVQWTVGAKQTAFCCFWSTDFYAAYRTDDCAPTAMWRTHSKETSVARAADWMRYLGPCHTPASVAALVEAARVEAAEMMREQAALEADAEESEGRALLADLRAIGQNLGARNFACGQVGAAKVVGRRIRALPLPSTTTQRAGGHNGE